MTNLYFPICGFFIIVLIVVIFFSRKRVGNLETKLYGYMIISSLIDIVLGIIILLLAYFCYDKYEITVLIVKIINKIDFIHYIIWPTLLFLYTYYIIYNNTGIFKKIKNIVLIFDAIAIIIEFLLPIKLIRNGDIMGVVGLSPNFIYCIVSVYVVLTTVLLLINIKNGFTKKYIPIIALIIFLILAMLIRTINPTLLVIPTMLIYIDLIMYFTIENPDLKMVQELQLSKNEAEKANRAKSDFLSSMSHEIRTPLNAIVGFSECIIESNNIDEMHHDAKDVIDASTTLLEIVNGILDISKIESGKLEIINSAYQSKNLLNGVAKLITPRMNEKALDFQIDIAEDIPKTLYGDSSNLKKIITNLLSNASKYTDKGYVKYSVKCINNEGICRLIIAVEDSGRGIKKDNLEKIFNKFQRVDETKNTTIEGTGLGLAITKQLIELMGGKIIVQSIYGKGSKFTIIIDQRIQQEEVKKETEMSAPTTGNIDITGRKVLIVDDNTLNIKIASKLLSKYNLNIDTCISGYEALDKITSNSSYDLIFLDDMMPKLSGVETLKILRGEHKITIPVVALTANAISGMKEQYIKDGFDDYLAKPIDKVELETIVYKYLNKNTNLKSETINKKGLEQDVKEEVSEKQTIEESLDFLKQNGIDVDKGIELLGDKEFYYDTLKEFYNNIDSRREKLEQYKNTKNMTNYSIEVHSLKSDSKYLGFTKLAEIALDQELKSKDNNFDYINENYPKLELELDKINEIIKNYLALIM